MPGNYTSGGQIFLHRLRMLRQVVSVTLFVSFVAGILLAISLNQRSIAKTDWDGAITYAKARGAVAVQPAVSAISIRDHKLRVDAYSGGRIWKKNVPASSIVISSRFKAAWTEACGMVRLLAIEIGGFALCAAVLMFLIWSRFGRSLESDRRKKGSGVVLTANEVRRTLRKIRRCSDFHVGKMPLVKDTETRHILVTGSTGSGKTNLMHNLLPQVKKKNQPAIVIDQTGEMISRYYDPQAGDIIFNPFDARSHVWDFWTDCETREDVERFSKILIGFNRKQASSYSDPFWENAAESVFNACAEYLRPQCPSIKELVEMVCHAEIGYLKRALAGSEAARYLVNNAKPNSRVSIIGAGSK